MPLSVKQQRFVEGLLAGKSAARAYLDAGYKAAKGQARKHASRLMRTNEDVRAALDAAALKAVEKREVTADAVLAGLLKEARGLGPDTTTAGRSRAWELIGRTMKMFTDHLEVAGRMDHVKVHVFIPENDRDTGTGHKPDPNPAVVNRMKGSGGSNGKHRAED